MRKAIVMFTLILSAAMVAAQARPSSPTPPPATSGRLPVKRVVLYKNGIGYFEHTGRVRGNQELTIDFTSAQLNDVLKSLTVMDLGEGRITGVRYDSIAPLSERMKGLRLPLGEQTTRDSFLTALRGARVEVRSGATVATGRVLSVEQRTVRTGKGDDTMEISELALVSDSGELRSFQLGPGTAVRVLDRDLSEDVGRYLNLVGSSRAQDLRQLTISTAGNGDRDLFVSYISEVPVWKSTYRILMPNKPGAKPLLQGWAVVDNTVGEDWKDVQLSLVAGAPQSFIQQISQPYYVRRPVVGLPSTAMLSPQTHEGTMEEKAAPAPPASSPAAMERFGGGTGSAGGIVGGRKDDMVRRKAAAAADQAVMVETENAPVNMFDTANREVPGATGQEAGDLFEYNLKEKITIGKDQSALVPIINTRVDAEKVTLWNAASGSALRALWLTNSSGLTLDAGTFSIVEDNTFAGEALMSPLKPTEKRLISYAADSGVRVATETSAQPEPISRIRIARGVMRLTREQRQTETYTIHDADSTPRDVIIEHPARNGWKLAKELKPEETSASFHRFRVKVEPGKTETLKVQEYRPLETTYALSNITSDQITLLTRQQAISPALEEAFKRILAKKGEIGAVDEQLRSRQQEVESINSDQTRLRENMKALKGSAEEKALLQRYTRQLDQQEDRLAELRKQSDGLKGQREKLSGELDAMLMEITLDEEK